MSAYTLLPVHPWEYGQLSEVPIKFPAANEIDNRVAGNCQRQVIGGVREPPMKVPTEVLQCTNELFVLSFEV